MKWFTLLFEGAIHPSGDKKILPAEEFSQLLEASEILEKAQASAEKLKKKSQEKAEKLHENEKKRGFEEGLQIFNEKIFALDEELKTLRHNLQQMVLPIALKAAKRIVGKELELFPETIVDIVLQALKPVTESHKITIFVSKEDKPLLDKNKPRLQEILQQAEVLAIQERADIEPGGCIIKTESGMINATIENQWKALERAFETYKQNP